MPCRGAYRDQRRAQQRDDNALHTDDPASPPEQPQCIVKRRRVCAILVRHILLPPKFKFEVKVRDIEIDCRHLDFWNLHLRNGYLRYRNP